MKSYTLLGASDLIGKGVDDLTRLRPVLGINEDPMAGNATLRKDEWERIDDRVNEVMRERLSIVDDLRARGLVTPVSLGTILRVTERVTDMDPAEVSYDGDTSPTLDRPEFKRDVIPVPVISRDFTMNWRQLDSSRKRGDPLDVTAAAIAARKVRDKIQDLFANGFNSGPGTNPSNATDGQSIPGLVTAAGRLTISGATALWSGATPDIIGDTLKMLTTAYNSNLFGPFFMYVSKDYWAPIQNDYSTAKGDRTFMERILAFADIQAVRPLDTLPAATALLLQMTQDIIDVTIAQDVTTVQWEKNPFVQNFRVLMVGGPQIKSVETSLGTTVNGIVQLI
jgi:uncharacterized linocin/CFP29 family protein